MYRGSSWGSVQRCEDVDGTSWYASDPWINQGIMVVAMMDHHQFKPVKGKPTMLSPSMIAAFNFHHLEHSILAGRDWDLCWIQEIVRMDPSSYTPSILSEFGDLVQLKCASVVGAKRQECGGNDLLDFIKKLNTGTVIIGCTGKMEGRMIWWCHLC